MITPYSTAGPLAEADAEQLSSVPASSSPPNRAVDHTVEARSLPTAEPRFQELSAAANPPVAKIDGKVTKSLIKALIPKLTTEVALALTDVMGKGMKRQGLHVDAAPYA